jgi:uncharacterized iron-regulated protein
MLFRYALIVTLIITFLSGSGVAGAHTLRLEDGNYVTLKELVEDLKEARVIFIGESHGNLHHHQAQLEVIRSLHLAGSDLAIGLEMFRADSQDALDRWIKGGISFMEFMAVYRDNWKWWNKYSTIFNYARESMIPMVGLNLSRKIIGKVAREGIESLSKKEMDKLPVVQCIVDDKYRDFIRRAIGRHDLEGTDFEKFCEAQLLWDKVMARNLNVYMADNPSKKIVVLAGSGHSWKHGIPEQLKSNHGLISWRVILPEIPGQIQRNSVTFKDTDFLLLGLESGPFH